MLLPVVQVGPVPDPGGKVAVLTLFIFCSHGLPPFRVQKWKPP